jgi:hypothetical protein
MTYVSVNGIRVDRIVADQIPTIVKQVMVKDRDKHILVDGREGSGKSKLARQLAKAIDPTFNIDRIAFNGNNFIRMIKDPTRKKGQAVVLDEAYMAANSRAVLSDINRALVGVATEMRQLNLVVFIVLPTFFDLDKYFAIWRCETLFHVVFDENGDRGDYYIYPFEDKLSLYIQGKKFYNYKCWNSPYPACHFPVDDPIDEKEYNKRKMAAFRKRPLTLMERKWKERTILLMSYLEKRGFTQSQIAEITQMKEKNVQKSLEGWKNERERAKDITYTPTEDDDDGEEEEGRKDNENNS